VDQRTFYSSISSSRPIRDSAFDSASGLGVLTFDLVMKLSMFSHLYVPAEKNDLLDGIEHRLQNGVSRNGWSRFCGFLLFILCV
jgi:hypothetical protein